LLRSTAPPFPAICWKVSSSVIRRAPLQELLRKGPAVSNLPTKERCSSMKSEIFRYACPSFLRVCRSRSSSA
jgi:hypothetical protein